MYKLVIQSDFALDRKQSNVYSNLLLLILFEKRTKQLLMTITFQSQHYIFLYTVL